MDISNLEGNTLIILKAEDLRTFADNLAAKFHNINPAPVTEHEKERPISQPEAVEFLGKSRQTLTIWRRKGIISAHILGGRVYFFKSELLKAMNSSSNATK